MFRINRISYTHIRVNAKKYFTSARAPAPKLQLYLAVLVDGGRFEDGLKLGLLLTRLQALERVNEGLDRIGTISNLRLRLPEGGLAGADLLRTRETRPGLYGKARRNRARSLERGSHLSLKRVI